MFEYGFPKDWSTLKKLIWLKRFVASSPSWAWEAITGTAPLALLDAVAHPIQSLTQYGKCVQDGTPTPAAPVDILCNNGEIKVRRPSGMPIAYQMVEWLKPAGSIPITGFKTKSTQEIECVFYREQRGASYLYSSDTATSGTTNTTAYLTTGAGNWRWDGKSYSVSVSTGIKLTSIQNEDGVWLNGTKYGYYTDAGEFISTNDLRLSSGENATVRIYAMTIREGETVTLDLVPVQRVTDSAYGFYDKVSGNFYTNAEATFEAGDPIADPVEIYTDGEDEVLTVSGANRFDASSYTEINAYVNANTGVLTTGSPGSMTQYCAVIPCKPNTQYNITGQGTSAWGAFTSDSIGTTATAFGKGGILTTGANDRYLIGLVRANGDSIDYRNTLSVQEAQTVTNIPMLLSVGNYKDEAELIGGLLTHKVGIYVFDGTENWRLNTAADRYYLVNTLAQTTGDVLCTHGPNIPTGTPTGSNAWSLRSSRAIVCFADMDRWPTADDFKAWLASEYAAGTPVIVLYPLETETTEQTTAHALHTTAGDNTVSVTAAVEGVTVAVEYAKST